MSQTALSSQSNASVLSRFERIALEISAVIDSAIHAGQTVARGTLLMLTVSNSKHRAYFEATVKTSGAFSTGAATATLDISLSPLFANLRVNDVIESTAGAALGTISTINASTGAITLAANSTSNLAAGQKVRVALSQCALASSAGKVLKDEVQVTSDSDAMGVGYFAGVFVQANTTITAAALAALGGYTISSTEARLV
jgi:hypothetical protein